MQKSGHAPPATVVAPAGEDFDGGTFNSATPCTGRSLPAPAGAGCRRISQSTPCWKVL